MDTQSQEFFEDRVSLNLSSDGYRKILSEYYRLASANGLSDSQAERLYQLLEIAETDDVLSLLMNEIDELIYQNLDFKSPEVISHLENEASKVQEMIPGSEEANLIDYYFILSDRLSGLVHARKHDLQKPRVEMVEDRTRAEKIRLENAFSQNVFSPHIYYHGIYLASDRSGYLYGPRLGRRSIRALLKEESVSIFLGLLLCFWLAIIFLI
ncbi:hypothetical protein C8255_05790 [filamentous cyanobacterium CCP3]|nr:hypothetical protein C8255_05790 [filamentous cyanobacterium CCP3]